MTGLERYAKERVCCYSVGCKRRLAAAVALAQSTSVTLLDDPTAGIDVAARRHLWFALKTGLAQGHTIVITSQ